MPPFKPSSSSSADSGKRRNFFETARRLLGERGSNLTLSEIAVEMRRDAGAAKDADVVESILALRIGDVFELACDPSGATLRASMLRSLWADAVREILGNRLHGGSTSLPSVARALAVSPRTLQRRLADEGTNWRSEIDRVRREQADELMRDEVATVVAAARVGYSSTRAFRRALQRWRREQVGASGPQVGVHGPSGGCRPSASSSCAPCEQRRR